jgi:hypothetical protein
MLTRDGGIFKTKCLGECLKIREKVEEIALVMNIVIRSLRQLCIRMINGKPGEKIPFCITRNTSSFPFPFVPLQRRGCLVAPWFL